MNILLHTIALEPARWTPQRVSRPLSELLPAIAAAGFEGLEIFEPHLTMAPDESALADALARHRLRPIVLSSYLDLSPAANPDEPFAAQAQALLARVERFDFRKVRLFPGRSPSPDQTGETIRRVSERLQRLTDRLPEVQFLVETHDGSLADEPADMVRLMERCARPNLGLIWQPTVFQADAARAQFDLQKAFIRHVHLQNRDVKAGFVRLETGVIPWKTLLSEIHFAVDATLEFVPSGVCPPEQFDLSASLQEAAAETAYIAGLAAAVA